MSNHEGSPACLECDSHTGGLCSRDLYFEKISLQASLKSLFVAWVWCFASVFLPAGGVERGRAEASSRDGNCWLKDLNADVETNASRLLGGTTSLVGDEVCRPAVESTGHLGDLHKPEGR